MSPERSAYLMARIGHDFGDVCDRLIDMNMERLAWREKQSLRERGEAKNLPASDK